MPHNATPQQIHLGEIGQIALTVRDLERARNFYQHTLGMQFLFEAGAMAFFQCGNVRLLIGTSEQAAPDQRNTIIYFKISDIHGTYAALKSQNVHFAQEPHLAARMKSHDLWISFFNDPDGNTLGLMGEISRTQEKENH